MPATVTKRPYYYSFSKNQLTWRFFVTSPSDAGCTLQFKLFADSASNITAVQRTFETELKPATDGYVNVTVQDIVDSMIDFDVPASASGVVLLGKNIKKITVQYRRISDADPAADWVTNEPAVYVIKGGIELLKNDYNNYFYNLHGPDKLFATWQPKHRLVGVDEEWWMSLLFTNADIIVPDLTARKLRVYLEWTDGTSDSVYNPIPSTGLAYLLYHCNVGKIVKDAIAALAGDKLLWRFTMQVVGDADTAVLFSEAYTLYADYRVFYDYKVFNFFNSLGGIDHVRVLADSESSYSRGFIEADIFSESLTVGSPADKQYFQANFTRLVTNKSDTGYRHTKAEILAYQELLTSGLIFEIFDNSNKYRLIGLLNKSNKIIKTGDKRFSFYIEWRYPFVEQVYTPEIDLGVGYMAPCVSPVLVGTPVLPDGEVGINYYYTINLTGTAPFTLSAIVKPSWMTITLVGNTIEFGGIPDVSAAAIPVSFTINNCGIALAFSDAIDIAAAVGGGGAANITIENNSTDGIIDWVTPFYAIVTDTYPIHPGGSVIGNHAGYPLGISVEVSGFLDENSLRLRVNGITIEFIHHINAPGIYTFTSLSILSTDTILISLI